MPNTGKKMKIVIESNKSNVRKIVTPGDGKNLRATSPSINNTYKLNPESKTGRKPILGPSLPDPASFSSSSGSAPLTQPRRAKSRSAIEMEAELLERDNNPIDRREKIIQKRKAKTDDRRDYLNQREDPMGLELDSKTLFNESDSFQSALRSRDMRQEKKRKLQEQKNQDLNERVSVMRDKEDKTMSMLKALAEKTFGGSSSRRP